MKQRITEDQYNEISEEKKSIWYHWMLDHHYTVWEEIGETAFPGIGEMIEFLDRNGFGVRHVNDVNVTGEIAVYCSGDIIYHDNLDLCDALRQATKQILDNP